MPITSFGVFMLLAFLTGGWIIRLELERMGEVTRNDYQIRVYFKCKLPKCFGGTRTEWSPHL